MAFNQYNHSNWYPEYQPKPDIKPSNKYATGIWLVLAMLIVGPILLFVVLSSAGPKISCFLKGCRNNPVGQALPWSDQYNLGQKAAYKTDQLTIVESIYAEPVATWPQNWTISDTLKLTFICASPTQGSYILKYEDAQPGITPEFSQLYARETALSARQDYEASKAFNTTTPKHDEDLAAVRISPRDAELATWAQASQEAAKDNMSVAPFIDLEIGEGRAEENPVWVVNYWPISQDNPPGTLNVASSRYSSDFSSKYKVDAVTGEVLSIDLGSLSYSADR